MIGRLLLAPALILMPVVCLGQACHTVSASGTGNGSGSDWNNTINWGTLSTFTRGDTYYLGTGAYGSKSFQTPESGTTLITIKKAINSDHCVAGGWNDATMGQGQAVFTPTAGAEIWQFTHQGYWLFDGNGRTGRKSGHGFKLDNSNLSNAPRNVLHIQTSPGAPVSGFTFRYIEVQGLGTRSNTDHGGPINFSEHNVDFGGITNNILFEYGYIHDSSNIPVQLSGSLGQSGRAHDITFQYTTIARDASGSSFHGNGFYDQGNYDNITFRYGVLEDLEGTAWMGSNVAGGTTTNYAIYGNVFVVHSGNPYGVTGIGNGAIAIYNAKTVNGFLVYNNSFVNLQANSSRVYIGPEVTVSNVQIRNNLWYNTADASHGPNTTGMTASHNYYINTTFGAIDTNSQTGSSNPFVDWINENYHLAGATNAGFTLASPYNIDPDGVTRGADGVWDRGAFEFTSGGGGCSPVVSSLSLNPASVVAGNNSTGTVTISCAPAVNTAVALSSNNIVATVPATVTVLANQTTATFTVTTLSVCVSMNVTITATLGGSTTAALTVTPAGPCQGAIVSGTARVSGTAVVK